MALANEEAKRLNHEYIGTEHILLGLVREGSGVAANVLRNLGVDLKRIRSEVEALATPGPDMVTMGKLPITPRSRKVIEQAINTARNLNHSYVGTEHLLMGLLLEHDGIAAQVLTCLGLTIEGTRESILDLLGAGDEPSGGATPQSPPGHAGVPAKPAAAPGADTVELLDFNRRIARLEAAAAHEARRRKVLEAIVVWLVILTIAVVGLLLARFRP